MSNEKVYAGEPARFAGRGFWLLLAAVTLFSLFVNFWHLGASSIHTTDEALTGLTSRDMVRSGDWWTPTIAGKFRFSKPPLYFWLTALNFRMFGISLFALRFWAALAASGAVALTGLLGRRIYGPRAGGIAAAVLATSTEFAHEHGARVGCMDTLVVFLMLASFLFALEARRRPVCLAFTAFVLGLANLAKNFLGLLPLAILALTRLVKGRAARPSRRLAAAGLIFILVSGIWPASMAMLHRGSFWKVFYEQNSVGRFRQDGFQYVGGMDEVRSLPDRVSFLAKSFLKGIYPWSLLSPVLLFWTIRRLPAFRRDDRVLPPIWAALVLIGLASMANLRTWYMLMAFPAFALLVGAFLDEMSEAPDSSRGLAAASLALLAAAVFFPPNRAYDPFFADGMPQARLLVLVTPRLAAVCSVLAATAIWLGRRATAAVTRGLPLALAIPAALLTALPLRFADEISSVDRIARKLAAAVPAFGGVVTYDGLPELDPDASFSWDWAPVRWYLERPGGVAIRHAAAGLQDAVQRSPAPRLILTKPERLPLLRGAGVLTVQGRMESHGARLVLVGITEPPS